MGLDRPPPGCLVSAPRKRPDARGGDRHAYREVKLRPERDGQREAWQEAADAEGLTLAGWIRRELDEAAERHGKSGRAKKR